MLKKHLFRRASLNKCLCNKQRPMAQSKISLWVISIVPISLYYFTHVSVHFVHENKQVVTLIK